MKLKQIEISDGLCIFPDNWIVVNPEAAPASRQAGVAVVTTHEGFFPPVLLFFTDRTAPDFTQEELRMVRSSYQKMAGVYGSSDGSDLGFFSLSDGPSSSFVPCGARLIRNEDKADRNVTDKPVDFG